MRAPKRSVKSDTIGSRLERMGEDSMVFIEFLPLSQRMPGPNQKWSGATKTQTPQLPKQPAPSPSFSIDILGRVELYLAPRRGSFWPCASESQQRSLPRRPQKDRCPTI